MLKTTVEQTRNQMLDGGVLKYNIYTSVTAKGELPQEEIFVYKANDPADPTKDTFTRVSSAYDLEEVPVDRNAGLERDDNFYLTSYMSVNFTDLDSAIQGKQAIYTRINDLINNWYLFKNEFYADDQTTLHPTADAGLEDSMRAAYVAARTARQAAETALASAVTDVTTAETAVDSANARVTIYLNDVSFCILVRLTNWTALVAASTAFALVVDSVINSTTDAAAKLALQEGSDAWMTQSNHATIIDTALKDFCLAANANYTNAQAAVAIAVSTLSAKVRAKNEAEANLVSAQAAEDQALAAIKALCPTFDPASV